MLQVSRPATLSLILLIGSLAPAPPAAAQALEPWLEGQRESLGKLYLDLHRDPELSFEESRTGTRIGNELAVTGFVVTRNVGGHGVVAILENGPGPTVMVRTDLDGLPVTEETGQPYASTVKVKNSRGASVGTMHACGHDVHMTTLVGTARYLSQHRDQWSGRLMMIGQPAEERGAGASAMLDDGLFERFVKPDFALALHCHSSLATGKVAMCSGYAMANVDSVDITMTGSGGHGAYPHTTIDPVVMSARLVVDLQSIVAREIPPTKPAVITVGSFVGGTKHNIIPDSCHLQLTVRSYSDDVRKQLIDAIRRKANAAATSAGAPEPEIEISEGTPALFNDRALTARIETALKRTIGDENVVRGEPVMGGEDFSQYGRRGVPILMYSLGTIDQNRLDRFKSLGTSPPSLHSPRYYPDFQNSIDAGVTTMVASVLDLLPKQSGGND